MATLRTQVLRLPRLAFPWSSSSVAPNSTAAPEAYRTTRNSPLPHQSTRSFTASCPSFDLSADVPAARTYKEVLVRGQRRLPPGTPKKRKGVDAPSLPPQMVRKEGTVISVGRMDRTVRVRVVHQEWDKFFRRYFPKKTNFMVHDPRNSLREGDVIEFVDGWRVSRRVRHVVERIVAPFGTSPEERPAVMNWREREEELERAKKEGKVGTIKMGQIKTLVLRRLEEEAKRQAIAREEEQKVERENEAKNRRKELERQRIREEQEVIEKAMRSRRRAQEEHETQAAVDEYKRLKEQEQKAVEEGLPADAEQQTVDAKQDQPTEEKEERK